MLIYNALLKLFFGELDINQSLHHEWLNGDRCQVLPRPAVHLQGPAAGSTFEWEIPRIFRHKNQIPIDFWVFEFDLMIFEFSLSYVFIWW